MAVKSQEVELLEGGTDSRLPSNSSFCLNMLWRRGAWEVRDGFGQMSQRTTTFGMPFPRSSDTEWGIAGHMGSTIMKTNYGHEQIISVFKVRINTSNVKIPGASPVGFNNLYETGIVVHIDDITDGTHWEEALYQHTAVNERPQATTQLVGQTRGQLMAYWHGNYETGREKSRQAWVKGSLNKPLFFNEFRDSLIFGSEEIGTWVYYPTHYRHSKRPTRVQVDTHAKLEAIGGRSESSRVSQIIFTPGIAEGYPYFTNSTLPDFADAVSVGSSVVYAGDRMLFFSDPELPASVIAENFVTVPCEGKIQALSELLGNVYVFTESETLVYRVPSGSGIKSGGQFTKISDNVGCVGPSATVKAEGRIFWTSHNGIYSTTGNFVVEKTGAPVERFFTDYMTNPLTSYYPKSGMMNASFTQPQTTLQADLTNANMSYCSRLQAVMATFPENNASLVFTNGKWAVWTYESVAFSSGGEAQPGVTQQISKPWTVSTSKRVFMIGTPDQQQIVDPHSPVETILTNSYYLMEYGRGGALDRSVDDEDYREPVGYYDLHYAGGNLNSALIFEQAIKLDAGFKFPGAQATLTSSDEVYLVPVSAILPNTLAATGITDWQAQVTFNATGFDPITIAGGGTDIDFIVPNERLASQGGYNRGAGIVGRRVQLDAAGGSTINIQWDTGGGAPPINQTPNRSTPLLYLPFIKKDNAVNAYIGITPVTGTQSFTDGSTTVNPVVFTWKTFTIGTASQRRENSVVSPVDYAYKSKHIGIDGADTLMSRGLYALMLSRGPGLAADRAVADFDAGLVNTLVSSDRKGWMSQIIDLAGTNANAIQRIASKTSIRTRVKASSGSLVQEVFGDDLKYGASANTTAGNYLIDDEEVSVIATSDSTKGGCFSYMVFGHIQIRSQKVKLQSVKASFRKTAGRRRFGH
mgnify:FL=1